MASVSLTLLTSPIRYTRREGRVALRRLWVIHEAAGEEPSTRLRVRRS